MEKIPKALFTKEFKEEAMKEARDHEDIAAQAFPASPLLCIRGIPERLLCTAYP
jgi:hypothetical protein